MLLYQITKMVQLQAAFHVFLTFMQIRCGAVTSLAENNPLTWEAQLRLSDTTETIVSQYVRQYVQTVENVIRSAACSLKMKACVVP